MRMQWIPGLLSPLPPIRRPGDEAGDGDDGGIGRGIVKSIIKGSARRMHKVTYKVLFLGTGLAVKLQVHPCLRMYIHKPHCFLGHFLGSVG